MANNNKTYRVAINGFGRIGRLFFRQVFYEPNLEVVAINDLGDVENLAYLLKYDSVYRTFPEKISIERGEKNYLITGDLKTLLIQEKDPFNLPWKNLAIDIVIESTGAFDSFAKSKNHLTAGAKKTIITAPAKDSDNFLGKTVLMGINESELKSCNLSSNASCTTNATSPVMAIMAENPGVSKAILSTVHAITNTQTIVDTAVKGSDFRRGRAGGYNISPSTTGAALAVGRVIKELDGKFDGISLRVPILSGSLADITFIAKRKTSVEEINDILKEAEKSDRWKGILKTTEDQIVSSDIIGESFGAIVDLKFTRVIDGDLVKILSWYDNEWGYISTLVKHVLKACESI